MYSINETLKQARSGNYLIELVNVGDRITSWISYEFYYKLKIKVIDQNNIKRSHGVIVPGMGADPIQLNKVFTLPTLTFWNWQNFEDELLKFLLNWQNTINSEGHYND